MNEDDLVREIRRELRQEFPEADPAQIDVVIHRALARTADAPVTAFRSVLARRDARAELHRPHSSMSD